MKLFEGAGANAALAGTLGFGMTADSSSILAPIAIGAASAGIAAGATAVNNIKTNVQERRQRTAHFHEARARARDEQFARQIRWADDIGKK